MQEIFDKLSTFLSCTTRHNNVEEQRTCAIAAIIHYIDALYGRSLSVNEIKELQKLLYDLSRELEIRYGL